MLRKQRPVDWFSDTEADLAKQILSEQADYQLDTATNAQEQQRFAAQLSGDWNQQVLDNEDKLSPLAKVMERISILEEERNAANARLEEEFRQRAEIEEKFYREKRAALEEAAAEVSLSAYGDLTSQPSTNATTNDMKNDSNSTINGEVPSI